MRINDRFTVEITGYSSEGAGVARLDNGCVVFVDGAVRGDVCEIAITKLLPRICHARIERLTEESPHRVPVDCAVFERCGGCDFRHISYEEELFAKRKRVNDALRRIGGVAAEVEDILTTGKINGYRNNVQLKTDGEKVGFYARSSHDIVGIEHCFLASDEANKAIREGKTKIRTSTEVLDGMTFEISPASFFQINTEAALLLYNKAKEYAELQPRETLLDLYCGTGTITLFLGRDAKKAVGVEINPTAVSNARRNAVLNGITNAEFRCEDVSRLDLREFTPDCIVVDPPRRGLEARTAEQIAEASPSRIVYISCDAATMARDIKRLNGYEVVRACAVDMFPRTRHVECVVLLQGQQ
jgi:tRNA/tmRNA/rRNA uracil-C5-methylase (TrmA/RlmC/RlmD family)